MDLAKRGGRLSSKLFKGEGDIYGGGRISNFKSNGGSRGEGRRANFPKNEVSPLKSMVGQNLREAQNFFQFFVKKEGF